MSFAQNAYYQEKFFRLSLEAGNVTGKIFEECEFNSCSFISCKFEKCKFLNCLFNECIISAMIPLNCRISEVRFSGSKVIGVDWTKTLHLEGLEFTRCQVNYSNFKLLKIPKTKLIDCEAKEADFTETDLSQGVFRRTDFEKSRFFKTNLTGADFRDAKNYYVDVKNNTIKKARFSLPEALTLLRGLDILIDS